MATAKEIIEDYVHQYDPAIRELISSLPPEGDKKKAHFLRESLSLHQGDLFYLLDGKGHVIDISTPFREYLGLDFSHLHPIRKRAPVSGVYQSLFHLRPVVSLLYPLPGRQLLVIEKDLQGIIPLVRHFNSTEWKTRGFLSIISHDGVVVYHPDETLIRSRHRLGTGLQTAPSGEQGLKSYISEGKRYLYYQQSLQEPLGWIMHYSFPYSVLSSTITREIVVQSLILALLFFLLIVSLTFVIGRNLSGPVHEIASHLSREDSAREGERVPEEMAHGIREISLIINATNTMMSILAAEKEKLSVTLRSIGDGVITTDTEGRVILINKAAEGLTGWMQEEAAGRDIGEVFPLINEKTREKCENPVEKVLRTGKVVGLANHTALIARDGTERIIADSGAPIRDRESRVIGVVLVFRDITEKQKMEEELLKAAKLESLGILAGGIAHDFNNILTAILGNISLSKMLVNPEDKLHHRLSMAEKASLQAKDLVQQLLTFSKGGIPIRKSASVADIIRDSTGFILSGSNVKCVFHFPDDLWPVEVDAGQISQVINNLVLNAVHAMPEGGIIRIRTENVILTARDTLPLPKGKYIRILLSDEGVGIPEEHLKKIFDPYFTTKKKGSGLGLATTYSVIRKHDGHITLESKPGAGTTFFIYLPALCGISVEQEQAQEHPYTGKGKVLVMDDEENVRDIAGEMLKHLGYEVVCAAEGEAALTLYKDALEAGMPFDLVITDLTVPGGMGGKELIRRLYEIDPEVKAVVSSGYSNDPVMAHYTTYGFSRMVVKPYKLEELGKTVREVIST